MQRRVFVACAGAAMFLWGCGSVKMTKAQMLRKVAGKTRKGELRSILGEPDKSTRMPGGGEEFLWLYKASDGEVVFHVFSDQFEVSDAGEDDEAHDGAKEEARAPAAKGKK